jgi:ribosomal protein S18 acetylase RimI-like enzyme
LSTDSLSGIEEWCRRNGIQCVYLLAEPEGETMRLAADAGFRFVDMRVTLERNLEGLEPGEWPDGIRAARSADLPELHRIAECSHTISRFYQDGRFDHARCGAFYAAWIERDLDHGANVFVADRGGRVSGYVTCRTDGATGTIGLFAVAEEARGCSFGGKLVDAACRWFAANGAASARVVTQAANVQAQRMYQRGGFIPRRTELWYHRWFD